jgi:hypothetical protein
MGQSGISILSKTGIAANIKAFIAVIAGIKRAGGSGIVKGIWKAGSLTAQQVIPAVPKFNCRTKPKLGRSIGGICGGDGKAKLRQLISLYLPLLKRRHLR